MTATEWVVFVFSTSAKALLVVTLAYGITRAMRQRSAAERHVVWMLAAVCVLALPALTLAGPKLRIPVSRFGVADVAQPVPVAAVAPAATAHPVTPVRPSGPRVHARAVQVEVMPAPAVAPARPARAHAGGGGVFEANESAFAPFILVLWLAGFLIVGLRLGIGVVRTHLLTRGARPLLDPVLLVRAHGIAAEMGVPRPVRYLEGDELAMPITFGIVRASLLLPSSARRWSAARQEYVLRHELAHIRRRDSLSQLIAELGCAVYWFNPLMWYAAKRMQAEREHACDDVVLRSGTRPSDYATELLDIAGSLSVRRAPALAAIAMARRSHLRARVTSLLDAGVRRERASARLLVPAWIGAFLMVTPLSSVVFDLGGRLPPPLRVSEGAGSSVGVVAPAPEPRSRAMADDEPVAMGAAVVVMQEQEPEDCLSRGSNTNTNRTSDDGRHEVRWSGRECSGEVVMEGEVEFDDSFTNIARISRGGYLSIETKEDGTERSVMVRPASSGVSYEYRLNGDVRAMDAAAHEWLRETLVFLFRRLGFMADERAASMVRRGGPDAVLAEVDMIPSDFVQAAYLGVLIEDGRLDQASLERVLNVSADRIDSDYYLSGIITRIAGSYEITEGVRDAYIGAVGDIDSDYYRHHAFATLLDEGRLNPQQVSAVLRETARIGSDYYRAALLEQLAPTYGNTPGMRAAYLEAAAGMDSDYHTAGVLARLLTGEDLEPTEVDRVLAAAGTMESDYYLHSVLARVAAQRAMNDAALLALLDAAAGIESDYYQADLLVTIARRHALRGEVRSRFEQLVRDIESDTYRGQAAAALFSNR